MLAAQQRSLLKLEQLRTALSKFDNTDTSIVIFGSLARLEMTNASDLDWILLLDGVAAPEHVEMAHAIAAELKNFDLNPPGREGTFGTVVSSHDLVNHIGGPEDSNANTTRRILTLLESEVVGNSDAYDRVFKNILRRYLDEDHGLQHGFKQHYIPRFLLNDITRYWRTMTVDFAYKQRARNNAGFALRNIKLRMSRKLIYLAGLIGCFSCDLELDDDQRKNMRGSTTSLTPFFIDRLRQYFTLSPLDLLAKSFLTFPQLNVKSRAIFDAYEQYLDLLDSNAQIRPGITRRMHLDQLNIEDLRKDDVFQSGRSISYAFQEGIDGIFLDNGNPLGKLTIQYGIF